MERFAPEPVQRRGWRRVLARIPGWVRVLYAVGWGLSSVWILLILAMATDNPEGRNPSPLVMARIIVESAVLGAVWPISIAAILGFALMANRG